MGFRIIDKEKFEPLIAFCIAERKKLMISVVIAGLMFMIGQNSGALDGVVYIKDKTGRLIGLTRENTSKAVDFPLKIRAKNGRNETEKEFILSLKAREKGRKKTANKKTDKQDILEYSIDDVIWAIEDNKDKNIILPNRLENGTNIEWSVPKKREKFLILFLPFAVLAFLYQGKREKEKNILMKRKNDIKRCLPIFNDQLIMLMNCGLIFTDAFERIAEGFAHGRETDKPFKRLIIDVADETLRGNRSIVKVLDERAAMTGSRDFSRMVRLIENNQYKGVDLADQLTSEGEILWHQRKKSAEERGKQAETKLSFPLAMLLIVLIVITAAPAILQVQGG